MKFKKHLMGFTALASLSLSSSAALADSLQVPKLGSPERKALLDTIRETDVMKGYAKEWKIKQVTFFDVRNFVKDDWAYVQAGPGTADHKQGREPSNYVLHRVGGKWTIVDMVPDDVAVADPPDAAFKTWHEDFCKKHKGCPPEIFPKTY